MPFDIIDNYKVNIWSSRDVILFKGLYKKQKTLDFFAKRYITFKKKFN